ncbi:hypothetical protein [Catenovulum adriaticum]|uniref:Carboxypeptidase family protein n=1 Tax=Catenovulum adriaticum TaxID=2984846 RepID=A0ABY7AIM3_9ALTE|nr:hypothetical protein [Catenovulum sp. TS8]WAJ69068.1 hypothetical protein OLW01_07635 [Catenovulum sp. TS8]
MKLVKSTLSVALIAALTACGGGSDGGSDNDGDGNGNGNGNSSGEIIISGTVTKGTMKQATVVPYKLVGNNWVKISEAEIDSDTGLITDDKGFYSFNVPEYSGPVKVELQANENTLMVCDAVDGCGDIAFGADIQLPLDFKLSSTSNIDDSDEQITLNVSALTHIASELISNDLVNLDAQTIQQQNSKIGNAFGVEGNITTLTSTNFISEGTASVDGDVVADAAINNKAELKYALVNAGIASALFKATSESKNIAQLLTEATDDIITAGGSIAVNNDNGGGSFVLTTKDVLDAAAKTSSDKLKPVVDGNADVTGALTGLETEVITDQVENEQNAGEDGRVDPDSTNEPVEATPLEKAKSMVTDVRVLTELLGVYDKGDSTSGFVPAVEQYENLLLNANDMIEAEANSFTLLEDIELVLSEINALDGQDIDDGTITDKTYNAGDFGDGNLTGSISFNANTLTFTLEDITYALVGTGTGSAQNRVAAKADGSAMANLTAKIMGFESDASGQEFSLQLTGSLTSSGAIFTFNNTETSLITVKTSNKIVREDFDAAEDVSAQIDEISVNLSLQLAQQGGENPVTFEGQLKGTLVPQTELVIRQDWDWEGDSYEPEFYVEKDEIAIPEMFSLVGEFSSLEGQSVSATLTVNVNNARDFETEGFDNFGKTVNDVASVTVDSTQKSITFSIPDGTEVTEFTGMYSGDADNWISTFNTTLADNQINTEIEQFATITQDGANPRYVYTYIEDEAGEDFAWAEQLVVEPNGSQYDVYYIEDIPVHVDDYLGADGLLKDNDGNTLSLTNDFLLEETVSSFDSFLDYSYRAEDLFSFGDPREAHNLAEIVSRAQANHPEYFIFPINNLGPVQLQPVEYTAGLDMSLSGYQLNSVFEDEVTVQVDDDLTQIDIEFSQSDDSTQYMLDKTSDNNYVFTEVSMHSDYNDKSTITASTQAVSGISDAEKYTLIHASGVADTEGERYFYGFRATITPVDNNQDELVDEYQITEEYCHVYDNLGLASLDECNWDMPTDYTDSILPDAWYYGQQIDDVIDATQHYTFGLNYYMAHVAGVGHLESDTLDIASLRDQKSQTLDAYLVEPENDTGFETESNYLDLFASLALGVTVDSYDVNLRLSGNRNGIEDGLFTLDLDYELADEQGIRDVKLAVDSKDIDEEGYVTSIKASNSAGVSLDIFEPTEAQKEQGGDIVLGAIMADGEQAGEVIYRTDNSLLFVKFSDDSIVNFQ